MTLFRERVGVHPSYIHSIEREGLIPSPDKLELLASVFVEVAREQDAADPEADARRLLRERDRAELIDRLGFDPELTDLFLVVREMDAAERAKLMGPLWDALTIYMLLDTQEQGGATKLVARLRSFVQSGDRAARGQIAAELAEVVEGLLDRQERSSAKTAPAAKHDLQTPA